MKWTILWIDMNCYDCEESFDNLAEALSAAQSLSEEIDCVRLFLNEDHVATYHTPKKGYWS